MVKNQNTTIEKINYPAEWVKTVVLKDGTETIIRPIKPEDAPRLQAGFKKLSPQTIYLRFLQSFHELSDKQAQYFATVDYQHRMALVAVVPDDGDEMIIGVARYDVSDENSEEAETAIVVGDDIQGVGLGKALMMHLIAYAQAHGVKYFVGNIHMNNTVMMNIIKQSGLPFDRKVVEPGVWNIRICQSQLLTDC